MQNQCCSFYCSGVKFSKVMLSLLLLSFCVLVLSQNFAIALKNFKKI